MFDITSLLRKGRRPRSGDDPSIGFIPFVKYGDLDPALILDKIDDQEGISDPLGMSGVRLEATVHIITAAQSALQNIVKCTEKAQLKVSGFVLESLAASAAVLSKDEK